MPESSDNLAEPKDINRLFGEGVAIDAAMARAGVAARREYIRWGHSMPVWRDGRVVWIPPEEIEKIDKGEDPSTGSAAAA